MQADIAKNKGVGAAAVSLGTRVRWLSHTIVLGLAFAVLPSVATTKADAQTAPVAAGLEAGSEAGNSAHLPLVSEQLVIRIEGEHASSTYTHVFQNESQARLEGNYHLIVGEGASATGFAYWNGEQKIVGEMFEREAAQKVYEALTGLHRDPGLLEQTGEGAFAFHVFPIEPGEQKRVQVSTSRWLLRRGGPVEFRARVSRADAAIAIDLVDSRGIKSFASSTHDLDVVQTSPTHWHATVKSAKTAGAQELVLAYETNAAPWTLVADLHHDAGQAAYFTASLATPPSATSSAPATKDVTLVLDRSGSMEGDSMASARKAAVAILDKLGTDDSVNVIAFDDKIEPLWPQPKPNSADTLREAKTFIERLDARGGTEIAKALTAALGAQKVDQHAHVILFLTDGQSDGPSAIAAAQQDTSDARVFTVGIGLGVDKALLARLAQMKHGRFSFIADVHAVETEFPRVLSQLEEPMLTDVKLTADGATIDHQYPNAMNDLFPSDELRVFGRVTADHPIKLSLDGKDHGTAKHFEVTIDPSQVVQAPFVARGWARSRVDDLMGDMREKGETDERKNEAIELGLAYDLVTPYTSFLAVPEKEMTDAAQTAFGSMRAKRQAILASNKDAAALSRQNMPPGDPVLKVHAPKDAKRVVAMFPFGLAQDLAWDDFSEAWTTRFLVPNDVVDGEYEVRVIITGSDERVTATTAHYTIDSKAPAIEVDVKATAGGADIRVMLDETPDEVRIADVDDLSNRSLLMMSKPTELTGHLVLSRGHHRLRVVVADKAHNEDARVVEVDVP